MWPTVNCELNLKLLRNSGHEENVRPARHRVITMRNSTSVAVFPHTSAMQCGQTLQDIYQNNKNY